MALIGTSLTAKVYTALYTSQVSDGNINVTSSTGQGRTESVLDFNSGAGVFSRDLETVFSWPISQGTILYVWQPSLIIQPETTNNRWTDWIECEGGTGYVQGILIEANTFNVPKVFQLQDSDTLTFHPLNEVGAGIAFNGQSVRIFSCAPFIAHSVRVTTTDAVPWQVWRTELSYQPFPSNTLQWTTELTALGGEGWQHLRLMNFAHISTAPITLTFTVDTGNGSIAPLTFNIPSSGGTQTKTLLRMSPNKWKLIGFSAVSASPMRLFLEDMEVWVKSWGSAGPYRKLKPFGGKSSPAAEL